MNNSSSSTSSSTSKTSQNGSGVPQWLEELGVKRGRYYTSSKARPERLMQVSLTADAQKVHACLELGSMGYQREDAVCTVKDGSDGGKHVRLTPGKIAKLTGISKEHVLRAIKELEYYGLAQRFLIDPARGEVKGNVSVRSWALPRPMQAEEKREPRAAPFLDLGAEYKPLARFISRLKLDLDPDKWGNARGSNLEAALAAVAKVEEAEKAAVALLKGFGATERIYKEESNGDKPETNTAGRQAVVEEEENLPAGHPLVSESNGNATPGITTAEQILELPAVQQLEEQLQDTVGPELASLIAINLLDAPPAALNERILLKAKDTRSLALLPRLAADVAKAHAARKTRAQNVKQDNRQHMQAQEDRTIADLLQGWSKLSRADRQMARETWPEKPWPSG